MKIQSLSIVVPSNKCINDCKFCVAKMVEEPYPNQVEKNRRFFDLYQNDYIKRMNFARDNGCNTVMITGNCEPQQSMVFLEKFGNYNKMCEKPFRSIEIQTTGTLVDDECLRFLRNHVGVTTISLSISSLDDYTNAEICGMRSSVNIIQLCNEIKRYDFNLRLSLNLTEEYNFYSTDEALDNLFSRLHDIFLADQITFRVLYSRYDGTSDMTSQDKWIHQHAASPSIIDTINAYIKTHGSKLERLEFGVQKYSINGMSVVLDDNCMSKSVPDEVTEDESADGFAVLLQSPEEDYKYLILRPNCKLYSRWDDVGSLIF